MNFLIDFLTEKGCTHHGSEASQRNPRIARPSTVSPCSKHPAWKSFRAFCKWKWPRGQRPDFFFFSPGSSSATPACVSAANSRFAYLIFELFPRRILKLLLLAPEHRQIRVYYRPTQETTDSKSASAQAPKTRSRRRRRGNNAEVGRSANRPKTNRRVSLKTFFV